MQQGAIGQNCHRLVGLFLKIPDDPADAGMQGRLPGSGYGEYIQFFDRFLFLQQLINLLNDYFGRDMFAALTGQLWCCIDFSIYAIEIAGLGRQ